MITRENFKARMASLNPLHEEIEKGRVEKELLRKRLIEAVSAARMSPAEAERQFKAPTEAERRFEKLWEAKRQFQPPEELKRQYEEFLEAERRYEELKEAKRQYEELPEAERQLKPQKEVERLDEELKEADRQYKELLEAGRQYEGLWWEFDRQIEGLLPAKKQFEELGDHKLRSIPTIKDTERLLPRFWTLEMTIAWIVWRDLRDVLRHHAPSLRGFQVWEQNKNVFPPSVFAPHKNWSTEMNFRKKGYDLRDAEPTSFSNTYTKFDGQIDCLSNHLWAIEYIIEKAYSKEIISSAFIKNTSRTYEFLRADWAQIEIKADDIGEISVNIGDTYFDNLKFNAHDILSIWEIREQEQEDLVPLIDSNLVASEAVMRAAEIGLAVDAELVEAADGLMVAVADSAVADAAEAAGQGNAHPYEEWAKGLGSPTLRAIGLAAFDLWVSKSISIADKPIKQRNGELRDRLNRQNLSTNTISKFYKQQCEYWKTKYY